MGNESDLPLSVTLTMTEETRTQIATASGAIEDAEAYVIDCPELAIAANEDLRLVKQRRARLEELRKGFVQPAMQILHNANALFKPPLEALARAEEILKQRLLAFQMAEERKAAEERKRFEEDERRARQEADAKAAAERAKAAADAAQKRKMAEEVEAAREKLEAEGKARQAKQAAADAARLRELADQAIENGENKARQVQLAASAKPSDAPAEPTKLEGSSVRANWTCELLPGIEEKDAILLIVNELRTRPELVVLLRLDMSAARNMAKALRDVCNIPGMRAVNIPVMSVRR